MYTVCRIMYTVCRIMYTVCRIMYTVCGIMYTVGVYCMWDHVQWCSEGSKGLHVPKRLVVFLHTLYILYICLYCMFVHSNDTL